MFKAICQILLGLVISLALFLILPADVILFILLMSAVMNKLE